MTTNNPKRTITRQLNKIILLGIFLTISCLADSCSSKHTYYSEFKQINKLGWSNKTPLYFTPTIHDSINKSPEVFLTLRHDNFYEYRNLWLFIDYISNNGETKRDTINCELSDIYGEWSSKGFGAKYEYVTKLNPQLPISDTKRIIIWQGMRTDSIKNISDIGITISDSE